MLAYFRNYFRGLQARRVAETWYKQAHPNEIVHGASLCADEPGRFVVRVFVGQREFPIAQMLPPWRICVIVGVDKTTLAAEIITNDELYRPVLR